MDKAKDTMPEGGVPEDVTVQAGQSSVEAADKPIQHDLFVGVESTGDLPIKDDMTSMEYPIFSLSKNPDLKMRTYTRGGKFIRVIPSSLGAATVFDKDLIIYAISKLIEAHKLGLQTSPRVKVEVYDFLSKTQRSTGGAAYARVIDMCRRLTGTNLETNIKTNELEQVEGGFRLMETYIVTRYTKNGGGALDMEVVLSDWVYRQALAYDVLTLAPEYFGLKQSLERRLYELARKHVGEQAYWKVNLPLLQEKCGSRQTLRKFRQEIVDIIERNALPQYKVAIDESAKPNDVVFLTRDNRKLLMALNKEGKIDWLGKLFQKKLV